MKPLRIGAVSYLNAIPLLEGLSGKPMPYPFELYLDYPSSIARSLLNDEIDLGLVPVALLPELKTGRIVSDWGIACDGAVASVCLFSDRPLDEVETIWLDYQSRSSVALIKILCREHWKLPATLVPAEPGFEEKISGSAAGLVIGDRAFTAKKKHPYCYDLGLAWKEFTGLPFVFAAWISNKPLPADVLQAFNDATGRGTFQLREIAEKNTTSEYDLYEYYTANIKYRLTEDMRASITLFLDKIESNT